MVTPHTSLLSSIVSGVQWVGLGIVAQVGLRIGVLAIMARLVPPRDFGLFAIALIFTSFAERLGQVGVGAAFIQRAEVDADDLKTAVVLSVGSGVIIAAALYGISSSAATIFHEGDLRLVIAFLSLGFIMDGVGVVSDGLLQRELRFREIVKVETVSFTFGLVIVGVTLGLVGFGVWALVGGNLAMRASKAALLVWARPVSLEGRFSLVRAKRLLSTGFGFSLGKVLNFLSLQGDNFVVGRLLGTEALGMYTRAYQAMTLPAMYVGQAFERVLFPALSHKQNDTPTLRKGLLSTLEISAIVALPVSVGMFFLSEEIVLVLFGEVWRPIVPVLKVLSCGVFFRAAYKCSDVLIRSKGDVYAYAARQGVYTAVIVLGSLVGARIDGTQGVAYAVVGGVIVNYLLMTRLAGRLAEVPTKDLLRVHVPGIWVAGWIGVALTWILPSLRAHELAPWQTLVIAIICAGVVGCASWKMSGPLTTKSYVRVVISSMLERRRVVPS
jgi:O-antigen/teichoic acid export membrane protein